MAVPAGEPHAEALALLDHGRAGADARALASLAHGGMAAAPAALPMERWAGCWPTASRPQRPTRPRALDVEPPAVRAGLAPLLGAFAAFEAAARVDPVHVAPQRLALLDAALASRYAHTRILPACPDP